MGGVETHCEELMPRIKALRPALDIKILARAPYVGQQSYTYRDVRIIPLPSLRQASLEAIFSTLLGVLYAQLTARAHIVHIHAIGPALWAPLVRLLGAKVVITHHGKDYERAKWNGAGRAMLKLGEWAGMQSSNVIIAISPSLAEDLKTRFPRKAGSIVCIPNGAPAPAEDEPHEDVLSQFGLQAGQYVVAVGRLVPEKGFHDLIAAHRQSGDSRTLVIVGDADHDSDYSRGLKSQAHENVVFAGRQKRSVVRQLLERASLFVLPSYHEGLPIAALEAAAAGAPILLSDIAPNRDLQLADRNYFPTGDIDALAARLAAPADSYRVDATAVCSLFSWDRAAIETLAVYDRVSNPSRNHAPLSVAGRDPVIGNDI
jgi:glycosyltransferase involved in cell wall biosynthesis